MNDQLYSIVDRNSAAVSVWVLPRRMHAYHLRLMWKNFIAIIHAGFALTFCVSWFSCPHSKNTNSLTQLFDFNGVIDCHAKNVSPFIDRPRAGPLANSQRGAVTAAMPQRYWSLYCARNGDPINAQAIIAYRKWPLRLSCSFEVWSWSAPLPAVRLVFVVVAWT